jgi:hypothetical protein
MYTSYIGLKFLDIYNAKTGYMYSAEEFFDKEMFPLLFDNERHLMHVSNSPFFQSPSEKELKQTGLSRSKLQYQKLQQKIKQVAVLESEQPDASIYVGYAANGPDQTTAGQVSNLTWKTSTNELYASWIGNALSARVEGSQCLLIDSEPVLWHIYEGWKQYRQFLEPLKQMDGRQIETWNGYWLAKGSLNKKPPPPPSKDNKLGTCPWVEVLANLLQWHSDQTLPIYIFSLGQTNNTYGFINIHFPQLQRLSEARHTLKQSIFSFEENDATFWECYQPDFSLREACQLGEIGLRALRPKDFGKLMEGKYSSIKFNDKNKQTLFNIQTWIIAMLNNKSDLQQLASDLASELVAAESNGNGKDRGKMTDNADSKAMFEAKGLTTFIEALTTFLEKNQTARSICRSVADEAIRIPGEQFPLFRALIRFEYAFLKNK